VLILLVSIKLDYPSLAYLASNSSSDTLLFSILVRSLLLTHSFVLLYNFPGARPYFPGARPYFPGARPLSVLRWPSFFGFFVSQIFSSFFSLTFYDYDMKLQYHAISTQEPFTEVCFLKLCSSGLGDLMSFGIFKLLGTRHILK
jgi:hypothetical protein